MSPRATLSSLSYAQDRDVLSIASARVTQLARALQDPDGRSEATEALRGLVDADRAHARPGGGTLQIGLKGILAAMLGATVQTKRSSETDDLSPASMFGCGGSQPAEFGVLLDRSFELKRLY